MDLEVGQLFAKQASKQASTSQPQCNDCSFKKIVNKVSYCNLTSGRELHCCLMMFWHYKCMMLKNTVRGQSDLWSL